VSDQCPWQDSNLRSRPAAANKTTIRSCRMSHDSCGVLGVTAFGRGQ
jgi:hypothetical protein